MTEPADSPATQAAVAPVPVQVAGDPPPSSASFPTAQEDAAGAAAQVGSDRPELVVGGAFAAGFVIAMILKRLGR